MIFIEHSGLFVMTIFASRIVYRSYKTVSKILHHETRKGVVRMQNGISITAVCRCLEERRYWSRCLHSLMIRWPELLLIFVTVTFQNSLKYCHSHFKKRLRNFKVLSKKIEFPYLIGPNHHNSILETGEHYRTLIHFPWCYLDFIFPIKKLILL